MEAKFRITEADYVNAGKLFSRTTTKVKLILLLGVVLLVLGEVFGPRSLSGALIGGLLGGTLVAVLIKYIISPYMLKRHYRKYKAMHEEFTIQQQDNGVFIGSSSGEGIVKWDNILKWRQNDDYILLYPMPRLYHIVPKSIAKHGFDIDGLVESLKKHVGSET
ncbi:YcxB family protein [Cocleimonas sp. KMM 6892]|uniref:YcxB family protein n=1 Tax=unclassified Cocleimonas TaxID=2639732 RepID=UPI002DBB1885|nr:MULTISPECIES: YcxB family protein [unclassified Cocleimonas]MEB8434045.1 YcxB family protein [Cocleimonas sp. KMM 6892]MEC4716856.1 YcxB family protein [Cocleimonas sp. KMM 6895]MEC4745989.1 YcxB family protein [Cocleimonas sp. KMM 6896]